MKYCVFFDKIWTLDISTYLIVEKFGQYFAQKTMICADSVAR